MRRYIDRHLLRFFFRLAAALCWVMAAPVCAISASPDRYAPNSVLSHGSWVKINISTPGLQTISRQTLKNFGFSDPNSVYVYGYGGRMISEALSSDHPDDLPPIPVVRTSDGSITFYATSNISIKAASSSSEMAFDHTISPYGDTSYYFLSDVAPGTETEIIDMSQPQGNDKISVFTCMSVHERDLQQYAESGRDYLGEDFKTNKSQTFKFDLPDNAEGGNAKIRVKFGANTVGAQSSILVSANGTRLPATAADRIAAVTSGDQYYKTTVTTKAVENAGNNLTVGIEYSQAGTVSVAALDWIEVEYERELTMRDSRLYFHVNPSRPATYVISGVTPQTVIWDVTRPWDIKEVKGLYNDAQKTLSIGIGERGLREFIAFEPSVKGSSTTARIRVSNQDIHGLPTPDMVIITPDEFVASAQRIADLHRNIDGMTVHVLSPEKIFNEFSSGNPDVSAFRKLLKMWYDRSQADPGDTQFGYCLLMGRPTFDQKRKNPETIKSGYPRTLTWQSATGLTEATSYSTDDFIAMLEDETSVRNMAQRKILIGVGRYTVTSQSEAETVADKLEAYMTRPEYGVWRNNVMVIADDGDNAQHLNQAQKSISNMQAAGAGPDYAYERLYLDAFERKQSGSGLTFPDAKERMLMKWQKEGVALINYIGHANPKEWGHEKLLTWNDINNMDCQRLPIIYAATCSFGKWDAETISGAEHLLMNPAGGVISIITPSRTVYISRNEYITNSVSKEFFRRDTDGKGQRLGDILRIGKNLCSSPDDNMLRYHLFGDPALRMPTPQYSVRIDSIGGKPVAQSQADAPTVEARSSVTISGRVTDPQGEVIPFNGQLQYTLYDAEKSITTHGWGDAGKESVYDDRSSKLATGCTMVSDGLWETSILLPSEISNNYSPALISLYAFDEQLMAEANGSTDKIFVYGYNNNAPDDTEGPIIEKFGINSLDSGNDVVVHSEPVAMAVFSDESGINISDAGIGQRMTLLLDGKTEMDDISYYFSPDPEDSSKGSLTYPLRRIEPGTHDLTLTVWDNAGNSSKATLNFKVSATQRPGIGEVSSFYNREADQMTVKVTTDRTLSSLDCTLECFDLEGNRVWTMQRKAYAGKDSSFSYTWDLNDANGMRIPRGIYMMKVTVATSDGLSSSVSKKIAIPAK